MKKQVIACSIIFVLLIPFGCAPTKIWTSTPASSTVENQYFSAQFMPLRNDKNFINQFRLVIWNKSDSVLEVDWSGIRYIYKGRRYGRFIFEGLDENNVNNPPPDIVPVGGNLLKIIAPVKLIAWKPLKSDTRSMPAFSAGPVMEGESGIALVVNQNGHVIRETITVTIKIEVK